jgi:SAM-dependent methyltransferase
VDGTQADDGSRRGRDHHVPPDLAGPPSSSYDQLATYYDLIYADVKDDIPFYVGLAGETGGPVLELGCGSGRTLFPLAQAGFEVVGLDNSEAMLERAEERAAVEGSEGVVHLLQGEMTSFDLGRRFPLITVPFNTWLHLPHHGPQAAALRCIDQHLIPGGWFVMDLPAPATIVDAQHDGTMVLEGIFSGREPQERVLQFSSTQLDSKQQTLHVTWIYDLVGADGDLKRTIVPMSLHYLFPRQAQGLLEQAGLKVKAMWGDYDRAPYTIDSGKLIILSEK